MFDVYRTYFKICKEDDVDDVLFRNYSWMKYAFAILLQVSIRIDGNVLYIYYDVYDTFYTKSIIAFINFNS